MSIPGLSGAAAIAWVNDTSTHWRTLFQARPEALNLPCDIRETQNVRQLVQHIHAVELRYAQRLSDLMETPYETLPLEPLDALYAIHAQAMTLLRTLQDREAVWWMEEIDFTTRSSGTMRAQRNTILVHCLLHSIRHYAQLATLVRQHGISCDWPMDYLFMQGNASAVS